MEQQDVMYFMIMVSLVLGIGNTYYIVKYLTRITRARLKESNATDKEAEKTTNIKD